MSRQHKLTLLAVTIGTWSPLALGTRVRLCERVLGLAVTPSGPLFGDLWIWLQFVWLHFEVVRGPAGIVWGPTGTVLGPKGSQLAPN